nr:amidohydrolase [uncultured Hyphomonas sp.]
MIDAKNILLLIMLSFGLVACSSEENGHQAADLILRNGVVVTMEAEAPQASAVAIRDGVITAVGDDADVDMLIGGKTTIIDAAGRFVVPGFIDTHMHPHPLFDEMSPFGNLDLTPEGGIISRATLMDKLRQKVSVTPPGQLIIGMGYNDNIVDGHPTARELDLVAPNNPVILVHSSGHRSVVNTFALDAAGITDETPDTPGSKIERDEDGHATGIILERVPELYTLYENRPEPGEAETLEAYRKEFRQFLSNGIVAVADASATPETLSLYRTLLNDGLPIRVYAMTLSTHLDWLIENRGEAEWQVPGLTMRTVKVFHGNSLSGRTAWLYEPYANDPNYFGIPPSRPQKALNDLIGRIHAAGLQAAVHANGDREIDMVLDAFEHAQKSDLNLDARHRIEHGSVVNTDILDRMKHGRVALAPHSYVLNHGEKMEDYGAMRWNWMHPNRSALDWGIPIGGNSDYPVSPAKPMQRVQSMVTRKARSNGKIYGLKQRITIEDALKVWTLGSAYLQFEENTSGSIKPGKRGDLVVLSEDPRAVDEDQIGDISVDYTIVGGAIVYKRDVAAGPEADTW